MQPPLHEQICRARIDRFMRQGEVAALVGRSQSAISQFESGKSGVLSPAVVRQLCEYFGVNPEQAPPPEMDLLEGEAEALAFCPNYRCAAAEHHFVNGRVRISPFMFHVWRGPDVVHCAFCASELSYGCPAKDHRCTTPLTEGALFCTGCGEPLVATPVEWEKATNLEVMVDKKNAAVERCLSPRRVRSLPKSQLHGHKGRKGG